MQLLSDYNPENLKDKILNTFGGDDPVIMAFSNLSLENIKETLFLLLRGSVLEKPPEIRKLTLHQINLTLQVCFTCPIYYTAHWYI